MLRAHIERESIVSSGFKPLAGYFCFNRNKHNLMAAIERRMIILAPQCLNATTGINAKLPVRGLRRNIRPFFIVCWDSGYVVHG